MNRLPRAVTVPARRRARGTRAALALAIPLLGAAHACTGVIGDPGARHADPGPGPGPGGTLIGGGGGGGDPACSTAGQPAAESRMTRLTHAQYASVVRDLLRLDATEDPARGFQTDPTGAGFDNNAEQLRVEMRLGRDYRDAAERLAALAVADDARYREILGCDASGGAACARAFVSRLLRRAYRRPATDAEIARYTALFDRAPSLTSGGRPADAFRAGAQLVLEAALQSPNFLYRVELSRAAGLAGLIALGPHEVAARLALMLWNGLPDAALDAAADAGDLRSPDSVAAHAERMLRDPRARPVVADFHAQWLRVRDYAGLTRDPALFPEFSPALGAAMQDETRRFVEDVVFEQNGGLAALYTAPFTYANDGLARLYGLRGAFGPAMQRVELPPAERGGLFTQLGFLAAHAYPASSDPIHRGVFVQRQVLCAEIPSPPAGAANTPLPPLAGEVRTMRQRVAAQTRAEACVGCHTPINATGFAFEHYDAVGRYRTMDNGAPVESAGSLVVDGQTVAFRDGVELMRAFAATDTARRCYATRWFRYALQREESPADRCTLAELAVRMRGERYSVRDLLRDLSRTRAFLYRPTDAME